MAFKTLLNDIIWVVRDQLHCGMFSIALSVAVVVGSTPKGDPSWWPRNLGHDGCFITPHEGTNGQCDVSRASAHLTVLPNLRVGLPTALDLLDQGSEGLYRAWVDERQTSPWAELLLSTKTQIPKACDTRRKTPKRDLKQLNQQQHLCNSRQKASHEKNRPYFVGNAACWCGGGSVCPFCRLKEALGVGRRVLLFGETRYGVLRGDNGRLALFPAIGTDLIVAQSHRARHVLRDAVICGHA